MKRSSVTAGRVVVFGGFLLMALVFSVTVPETFLQLSTARNILDQSVVPIVLVCALTFVLITGEFDLSFTAIVGLAAGVVVLLVSHEVSVLLALGATVLLGGLIGLLVGTLVTLGRASSFIVTLAVGSAVTGIEYGLTGQTTIYQDIPESFSALATNEILGLRLPVWFALLVVIGAAITLQATRYGRQAQAVGSNVQAAYLAGVRVRRVKLLTFVMLGLLSAAAAIILTSRASSYYPTASGGLLLSSYVAAFLGAAVGSQNRFTVGGGAFGVVFITTLQTGLTLNNQPAWTSALIQGVVLAAAVLIAARGKRDVA